MMPQLRYTICFVIAGDKVLMLYRRNEPNKDKWNGLGGKIETGETPGDNILREMKEEAELDLTQADSLRFAGIITWIGTRASGETLSFGGMYIYIAHVTPKTIFLDRETREGILSWKDLNWVLANNPSDVTENISFFLPPILSGNLPKEYHCVYTRGTVTDFLIRNLPEN